MEAKVANAPCTYGAFEITIGLVPGVPEPDELLAAMAAAGYAGTELGPVGYLGTGDLQNNPVQEVLAAAGEDDDTAGRARELGARVVRHPYNLGIGRFDFHVQGLIKEARIGGDDLRDPVTEGVETAGNQFLLNLITQLQHQR